MRRTKTQTLYDQKKKKSEKPLWSNWKLKGFSSEKENKGKDGRFLEGGFSPLPATHLPLSDAGTKTDSLCRLRKGRYRVEAGYDRFAFFNMFYGRQDVGMKGSEKNPNKND
ncbi:hypothetical protein NPIL_326981 [Nephila pilipes]|uniref:Uncharacterized protein n=1 Tax=Nephila pilipes TaxID=299642 RepID=A0A8X6TVU6_NEPPI|nr:hypothetical protein NPIL_326981 [Nephila pilipes]